ncbi:hypothetical protein RCL_jg10582.t1 [Rhizophagus clarus]|uniref:Uncharacterized protein n=1 Tax=Rhizophagus clarus TaxID=94130 RepID=A0A8H3QJI7_9GLOM|nr:hypothetical protein RCL_jg10582.t1 [Rhizophagus clarus]
MVADEIFEKIGKSKSARKELMHQMKKYRTRQVPFNIKLGDTEFSTTCIGKSNEEVHDIIVDAHLNLDDDLIETMEEEYVDSNMGVFDENKIIEDSENSMKEEYIDIQDVDEMVENENDIDWDSM